eukprot:14500_1
MSFGAVFLSIADEIIYYNQTDHLPPITSHESYGTLNIESAIKTLSTSQEKYLVHPNALMLHNMLENNHEYNLNDNNIIKNIAIDLSFDDEKRETNWIFHCQVRMDITVGIIVNHSSNQTFDSEIKTFFDSIYVSIQKYLIESAELPVYILRLRCHVLSQKFLFFANNPSCSKACFCCNYNKNSSYHLTNTSNQNLLDIHYKKQKVEEIELQRIKTENATKKQAKRKQKSKKSKNNAYEFEPQPSDANDGYSGGCYLDIHDPAGQDEFQSMRDERMREGEGFIMVYSITHYATFEEIQQIYERLIRTRYDCEVNTAVVLVGNKCDLDNQRQVSRQEGENLAKEWNCPFFESSAKQQINNIEIFHECTRQIGKKGVKYGPITQAKILMLGGGGVGKSKLTIRYVCDNFLDEYNPTVEDSYRKMVCIDGGSPSGAADPTYGAKKGKKGMQEKQENVPKLIDDVFGDLENMFYLLSDLVYIIMLKSMNG